MPRTKFPPKEVKLNGRVLSESEIREFESKYQPPLTRQEIIERQSLDKAVPDMSHLKSRAEFHK